MTADPLAGSPLVGRAPALARIRARELAFLAQVSLRLEIREALGPHAVLPPTTPNTWSTIDGREVLWLGPDEWLVVGEPGSERKIAGWLDEVFAPLHRSVVDVSSNRAVLELEGDGRLDLLANGCGLDLHPRAWRAGMCAQTLVGRVPVLLQERADATRVFVRPSLAVWLVDWMVAVVER